MTVVSKKVVTRILLTALFLLIGYVVVVQGISYKVLGYRDYHRELDRDHLTAFATGSTDDQPVNAEELGQLVLSYTAASLSFQMKYNSLSDPNRIMDSGEGHCKMYSYVMSSAYNQLAKPRNLGTCRVAYGLVYFYGINLHQFLDTPFFRNHDFCVVRTKSGTYAMDAILYDYLWIKTIPLRG